VKSDVRPGGLKHVAVAVRQNHQPVALRAQLLERWDDVCKRLEPLNLADKPAHLFLTIGNFTAVHDMGDCAMPDLAIRRVPTIAECIDHGVFEVSAPPPGDEVVRRPMPTFMFQEWL